MRKMLRLLRSAELEMADAARYYELQSTGLGQAFLDQLESVFQDIQVSPERWPVFQDDIRRRPLKRFPYSLLYINDQEEILVIAVQHHKRHPFYWLSNSDRQMKGMGGFLTGTKPDADKDD